MEMSRRVIIICLFATLAGIFPQQVSAQVSDADQLGMALEYFQSGKYHESLLLFQSLDKRYKLNARFKAYIGLCYYYEWAYKEAVKYFDKAIPQLGGLSPHERSVYYYAAAESYFQLGEYEKALNYFTDDAGVCYPNELGDVYYRMGLCHMFREQWVEAVECYTKSERYYHSYRRTDELTARLAQIANMKNGCKAHFPEVIAAERSYMLANPPAGVDLELTSPWESVTIPKDWTDLSE